MFSRSAMVVPLSTIFSIFLEGIDSPVKEASMTCKLSISNNLASAGTFSPGSRNIMSPGTNNDASVKNGPLSLKTLASCLTKCLKVFIALLAFDSCK